LNLCRQAPKASFKIHVSQSICRSQQQITTTAYSSSIAMTNKWSILSSIVKGEITDSRPSSPHGRRMATGAAAIVGTATLIGCSLVNESYEARLKAEDEKKEKAIKAFQEERRRKREQEENSREEFREQIRQKYGIDKKKEDSQKSSKDRKWAVHFPSKSFDMFWGSSSSTEATAASAENSGAGAASRSPRSASARSAPGGSSMRRSSEPSALHARLRTRGRSSHAHSRKKKEPSQQKMDGCRQQ